MQLQVGDNQHTCRNQIKSNLNKLRFCDIGQEQINVGLKREETVQEQNDWVLRQSA
jgi:hypothetical protein